MAQLTQTSIVVLLKRAESYFAFEMLQYWLISFEHCLILSGFRALHQCCFSSRVRHRSYISLYIKTFPKPELPVPVRFLYKNVKGILLYPSYSFVSDSPLGSGLGTAESRVMHNLSDYAQDLDPSRRRKNNTNFPI